MFVCVYVCDDTGDVIITSLQELDEVTLSGLVKDTGVLATKEYMKWNWNLIFSLLQVEREGRRGERREEGGGEGREEGGGEVGREGK